MVNNRRDPLDDVFAALAHPVRRHMLERLAEGPALVGELAGPHRVSAPAISRHLRVLESAGLVSRHVDGRVHRMDLAGSTLAPALAWLDHYHRFWSTRLARLKTLLETPSPEEEVTWTPPPPASRSASSSRSPRRSRRSTTRSRKPRR
ncbi:MAG: metalloregulator ArsR/SmtB family transcription factor [Candidatus Eisenbacteria bacterium]|nr:metalloregulator ArsR/SmtB family transcription factor [Candidatus Eisenbacteria bacterium]